MSDRTPAIAEGISTAGCVRCGQSNPVARGFCASCGAALKLDCVSCGTMVALTERFCGGCGTDLEQAFLDQWMEAHWETLSAWRLCFESKFTEAKAKVAAIASKDSRDPRFDIFSQVAEVADRALSRRKAFAQAAADQQRVEAETAREQQCMPALVRALAAIPPSLRDKAEETELRQARKRVEELSRLREKIMLALDAPNRLSNSGEVAGLLQSVARALELDATDRQLNTLARQLQEKQIAAEHLDCKQLVQQAKESVAQHDYGIALRQIESISPSVWDERWDAYRSDLRELAWLEQELRQQPFVSLPLLHFAKRLQKLAPEDARPNAWSQRVAQRLSRISSGKASDEEVFWTRQREPTLFGPTVRPLTWPAGLQADLFHSQPEAAQQMYQLAVAFGVALQGIGLARIETNLIRKLAKPKRGRIFGKVDSTFACGIDIGSHAVKVVKLSRIDDDPHWVFADVVPHETPLLRLESDSARHEMMVETVKRACEKLDVKNCRIGISVSGIRSLVRYFQTPKIDSSSKNSVKQMQNLIRYEAEAQIPFPIEDVCWESHQFGQLSTKSDGGEHPCGVALVAARTSDLQQLLDVFGQVKISPSFAQAECIALHNLLAHESSEREPNSDGKEKAGFGKTVALIECGAQTTNIVIGSDRHIWLRSFPFAAEEFTRRLAGELKITRQQADTGREQPWRAKRIHLLANALSPVIQEWATEVNRSFTAYRNAHPKSPVSLVQLSGGGSKTFLLPRHLVRTS